MHGAPLSRPQTLTDEAGDKTATVISEKLDTQAVAELFHPPRPLTKDVILICTVTLAMILNTANNTAVAIALPTLGRELHIVEYKVQWIISAYSLSSGCLLLFLGRLADLYGRKITFILGCAFMGVLGIGCGFAQDEITLDVLRGLQGIGAAASIPAALGILAHNFPPSPIRSVAFATFAAGAPVGAAIGGVLTQLTAKTWRSTFWFLTGLSAVFCIGGMISIDKDVPYDLADRRADWLGVFLVTAGLTLIIFVMSDGSIAPDGWKTGFSPPSTPPTETVSQKDIIALLIVGVVFLALFVWWEHFLEQLHAQHNSARERWWTPPPLMSVTIRGRARGQLAVVLAIAFLEWCSFQSFGASAAPSGSQVLYYQNYVGLNPILTMVRLLPMCVTGVLCNVIVALVVGRIPVVFLIAIGTLFTGLANLLFAVIDPAATFWTFGFPAAVLSVFGADFVFATGTLFVARVCLPHEQSVGGALFQTLTQVGTAFGIALATIVFDTTLDEQGRKEGVVVDKAGANAPRTAQLVAYKDAMWTGCAFGLCGSILAAVFLRKAGIVGHRAERRGKSADS
ncbi:efflux transporter [Trametes elegans]|nr:efflux transporter [Trametes elegans]